MKKVSERLSAAQDRAADRQKLLEGGKIRLQPESHVPAEQKQGEEPPSKKRGSEPPCEE